MKSDGMGGYPEHEKLAKVKDKSQAIGEFLEWAQCEMDLVLCGEEKTGVSWGKDNRYERVPWNKSSVDLLAAYFKIDLTKLEAEKRAMIDEMRKINEKELDIASKSM